MSENGAALFSKLPKRRLKYSDKVLDLIPLDHSKTLEESGIETLEDLYECMAGVGPNWYKSFAGWSSDDARDACRWLADFGRDVGEITERFYPPGAQSVLVETESPVAPIELLELPEEFSGSDGINRAPLIACSLDAADDLDAVKIWLKARAGNPNTFGSYRKEAERFLLWCLLEKKTALSSVKAGEASEYLRWLEDLGRTDDKVFDSRWRMPQSCWIGPKNASRSSSAWRPFNGPLSVASRRNAVTVIRQLFNFLKKTGYLIFNPFDQVSPKVPLLKGEGAPKVFADRSLTEDQWSEVVERLEILPEGWPRERMKLILMMGKTLGMRASEMLDAKADWIVVRRMGLKERRAIEVVGKGSKVRRLPLNDEQFKVVDEALRARGIPGIGAASPDEPLLVNLGRGRNPGGAMSRSGLYKVLEGFFDAVAADVAAERPMDAAKLRASSTHWLRHTFAIEALSKMSVNVVQAAMGHASVATTGRYLSPEEEEMSEAMASIRVFGAGKNS